MRAPCRRAGLACVRPAGRVLTALLPNCRRTAERAAVVGESVVTGASEKPAARPMVAAARSLYIIATVRARPSATTRIRESWAKGEGDPEEQLHGFSL